MTGGYGVYSQAYQKTAVITSDQGKLIVMLYDGAVKFLSIAADRIDAGDFYGSHTNLVKGKSIIAELLASLNLDKGGDIALNLQRLYGYMFNELIEANVEKDSARVMQVIKLLKQLRSGWKSIPAAGKTANGADTAGGGRTKKINLQG